MIFRTLLIDDELPALQRLNRLLQAHKQTVAVIDMVQRPSVAVEKINTLRPDLIFLDIKMPGMSGLELIEYLEHTPFIIFSTAYDEYALQAFETNSIDYLLKPIDPGRLARSLQKLQRITGDDVTALHRRLQDILLESGEFTLRRLQVRIGNRIRLLQIREIYFMQARDKYVEVHTEKDVYLVSHSLRHLLQQLPASDFMRLHRSCIVNLNHIEDIVRTRKGNYRARMKDGKRTELPVSRVAKRLLDL